MTVSTETFKSGPYTANGVTTVFAYTFKILASSQIVVAKTIDGATTTVSSGDYTVSGVGNPSGGNVTFSAAPAASQLTILRDTSFTQDIDLENQGAYYAETVETGFDLAVMRDQEMAEKLSRAVLTPPTDDGTLATTLSEGIIRLAESADAIDALAPVSADIATLAPAADEIAILAPYVGILDGMATVANISETIFTGDGVTAAFTLGQAPGSDENVLVWIGGAIQKTSTYSLDGTALTLSTAPPNGVECRALVVSQITFQEVENLRDETLAARDEIIEILDDLDLIVTPAPGQELKLSTFIRATPLDLPAALRAAIVALFANASTVGPNILDCEGIPVNLTAPFLIRALSTGTAGDVEPEGDVTMGNTRQFKEIRNLNVAATGGGWASRDYVFSIAGASNRSLLRYFKLVNPIVHFGGMDLIGIHKSGYYHFTIEGASMSNLGTNAIGIYSSRWSRRTGISSMVSESTVSGAQVSGDATDGIDNGNHGAEIAHADIRGTFGVEDTITAVYTEDGDYNVTSGWFSFMNTGIVTTRGGLNTRGVHFSMADKLLDTTAVLCLAPRGCSYDGDELDGCVYVFDNPAANSFLQGTSYSGYEHVSINGFKYSSAKDAISNTRYGAVVNFRTQTALNSLKGLVVTPDWARVTGAFAQTRRLVNFRTTGAGSWDGSACSDLLIRDTNGFGLINSRVPSGANIGLVRVEDGLTSSTGASLSYNPFTKGLEFSVDGTTTPASFNQVGNTMQIGFRSGTGAGTTFTPVVTVAAGYVRVEGKGTGWATHTGASDRTNFVPSSVALADLAREVKAIVMDLQSIGLLRN